MQDAFRVSSMQRSRGRGFTLVELIVAIAVISVASTIFISMYFGSVGIAKSARNHKAAMEAAREALALIQQSPGQFLWEFPEEPGNAWFPVLLAADPGQVNVVEPPNVSLSDPASLTLAKNFYDQFHWTASARYPLTPSVDPAEQAEEGTPPQFFAEEGYLEVRVVVTWEEKGQAEQLSLVSALPAGRIPERAEQ